MPFPPDIQKVYDAIARDARNPALPDEVLERANRYLHYRYADDRTLFAWAKSLTERDNLRPADAPAILTAHIKMQLIDMLGELDRNFYFWGKETVRRLVDASRTLISEFPAARLFGIGHSSSYAVYAAGRVADQAGAQVPIRHIPFSGSFLNVLSGWDAREIIANVDLGSTQLRFAQKNAAAGEKHFEASGFHPKAIVDHFAATGQKTGIVDCVLNGSSFGSAITFSYLWADRLGIARDALTNAVDWIALRSQEAATRFAVPDTRLSVPLRTVPISHTVEGMLLGTDSQDTDRFVPRFAPEDWAQARRDVAGANRVHIDQIKGMIDDTINGKTPRPFRPADASSHVIEYNREEIDYLDGEAAATRKFLLQQGQPARSLRSLLNPIR